MRNICSSRKLAAVSSIVTLLATRLEPQEIQVLLQLYTAGTITQETLLNQLSAGEVLGDEFDVEEEIEATQNWGLIEMQQPEPTPDLMQKRPQCQKQSRRLKMSWLDNLRKRKPEEPIKRLLFFSKQELTEQTYAVIRVTWFLDGKIAGVSETAIGLYEQDVIAEFSGSCRQRLACWL